MSSLQVTLSTGEVVTFRADYTHGADLAYSEIRYEKQYEAEEVDDGKGRTVRREKVPVAVSMRAIDAALPEMIEKVEKNGQAVAVSLQWIKTLPTHDYETLYKTLLEIR